MGDLVMFFGAECSHCHEMEPLVKKVEAQEHMRIERIEVWHNKENEKKLKQIDDGKCGGVPFFWNYKTKRFICGSTSFKKLQAWALGKE